MKTEESRNNLENTYIQVKMFMCTMLAFFLAGQALVAFVVAALLILFLTVLVGYMILIGGNESELIRYILHMNFPQIFPP
jgi:cytochrome c oxidase assembly factor CtaG